MQRSVDLHASADDAEGWAQSHLSFDPLMKIMLHMRSAILLMATTLAACELDLPAYVCAAPLDVVGPAQSNDPATVRPENTSTDESANAQPVPSGDNPWASDPRLQLPAIVAASEALRMGNQEECLRLLSAAIEQRPDLPPPDLLVAYMYLAVGNIEAGEKALDQAAVVEREHPEIFLTAGQLAAIRARNLDAWMHFNTALRADVPGAWSPALTRGFQVRCYQGMATIAERRRDWSGLEATLRRWSEIEPKNAQLVDRWARALLLVGRLTEAKEKFTAASKMDLTINAPEVSLAAVYVEMGQFEEAQQWYQAAIKTHPNDARGYLEYGGALLLFGQIDKASAMIDKAVKIGANLEDCQVDLALFRGMIARNRKEYAKAEGFFDETLKLSPNNLQSLTQLPLVLVEQQDAEKRERAQQVALITASKYPHSSSALATLGWVQFRLGESEEGERALYQATSGSAPAGETLYYLARVLVARRKLVEAKPVIKALQAAIDRNEIFILRDDARKFLGTASLIVD